MDDRTRNGGERARPASPGGGSTGTPHPPLGSLGERVWLVLGGGGLKGLAHIGAWRALQDAGVDIAGIVGTSSGALVGALIASGHDWQAMRDIARGLRRADIARLNVRALLVNGIRQPSVLRGKVLRATYARLLPDARWESLRLPLLVNAVDLATGTCEWFGTGARTDVPVVDALYASSALPVLYPPAELGSQALVDGGAEEPLGLKRAEEAGATGIIGIDVGTGPTAESADVLREGMIGVHSRIFGIMTHRLRRELVAAWDGVPLLYVRPDMDGYGTFDFRRIDYFVEEGYRAMSRALEASAGVPGT